MTTIREACGISYPTLNSKGAVKPRVELKILDERIKDNMPAYATSGSAGIDLRACIDEAYTLQPGETKMISSGIAIHLNDPSLVAQIHPRSGLGAKSGIVLGNLTGIADSDYLGPITIAAWNRSSTAYTIQPMDRIAQLVIVPVVQVTFDVVQEFSSETERGGGGFGSSGNK